MRVRQEAAAKKKTLKTCKLMEHAQVIFVHKPNQNLTTAAEDQQMVLLIVFCINEKLFILS